MYKEMMLRAANALALFNDFSASMATISGQVEAAPAGSPMEKVLFDAGARLAVQTALDFVRIYPDGPVQLTRDIEKLRELAKNWNAARVM
jgi:hypothetical protein